MFLNMQIPKLLKHKLKAFIIHFFISVFVILAFLFIFKTYLFEGPLFRIENVWQGLKILIPVDAVLGPILTFILFVPEKKSLKMDLSIIGTIQLGALLCGGYFIFLMHPAALVFVGDRFETISYKQLNEQKLPMTRFKRSQMHSPIKIYAKPPPKAQLIEMFKKGINYQYQVDRYYPAKAYQNVILANTFDLKKYEPANVYQKEKIASFYNQYKNDLAQLAIFVLQGSTYESALIILNKSSLKTVGYIDIDPWLTNVKEKSGIKD